MKSLKYFNKGRQSSLLVPFLFANCLLTFLALARRFGIPVYFPGQHIPVFLTANTFIAPLASGIIAFLLAPSAPIQERLAVRKVRFLSSLILFTSTAVVCVENIPLGIGVYYLQKPSSAHYEVSILVESLPQLLALSLLPSSVIILLIALFGRKVGSMLSLIYAAFYSFAGTLPWLSFVTPLGDVPPDLRFAQFIFSVVLYCLAILVWYFTAASAPILRLIDLQK